MVGYSCEEQVVELMIFEQYTCASADYVLLVGDKLIYWSFSKGGQVVVIHDCLLHQN
jgi:hypothetical protein